MRLFLLNIFEFFEKPAFVKNGRMLHLQRVGLLLIILSAGYFFIYQAFLPFWEKLFKGIAGGLAFYFVYSVINITADMFSLKKEEPDKGPLSI